MLINSYFLIIRVVLLRLRLILKSNSYMDSLFELKGRISDQKSQGKKSLQSIEKNINN